MIVSATVGVVILSRLALYRFKKMLTHMALNQVASHPVLKQHLAPLLARVALPQSGSRLKGVLEELPMTNRGRVVITLCLCDEMIQQNIAPRPVIVEVLQHYLPVCHTVMLMWLMRRRLK
ncbi:protein ORF45 [Lake sturgeon herpesvirus]|nr:protein ORF45 [Lake sturgeon herpesvirus]